MERQLPSTIDYTKILPLAVESRSRRRTFIPNNGQNFASDQNNVIRIDVSANAFLDTKHSYLRFRMTNNSGQNMALDYTGGHGFIQRLTILQQGTVLSDVHHYNRLLGSILLPAQCGTANLSERSISEGQKYANSGGLGPLSVVTAAALECTGAICSTPTNAVAQISPAPFAGDAYIFSIPLVNGLLGTSQDKMVPLQLLGSAPITIEITLAPSDDVGVFAAAPAAYGIDDVRYVAQLVEVGPEVDNQLRAAQAMSNGKLVLNGVDYTHFSGILAAGTQGNAVVNVPSRKKSMKSLLWSAGTQTLLAPVRSACYNLSFGGHLNMVDYYMKIGSEVYPPQPIRCNFNNNQARGQQGEPLSELAKCMGTLHSLHGTGALSRTNCYVTDCDNANIAVASANGGVTIEHRFSPFGIDLEAFQRTAIESGIDTASRSLPISLNVQLGRDAGGNIAVDPITIDAYVVYDSLYFIDMEGRINVSQ